MLRLFRVANYVLLAALVLVAGNYYLGWGLFGGDAQRVLFGFVIVVNLLMLSIPSKIAREVEVQREAQLARDRDAA
jgi:hypothetical protein